MSMTVRHSNAPADRFRRIAEARPCHIVAVVLAAALLAWPFVANERFVYHIAINVCLAAIAAASLHLIIRTGHVSLCHAAFIGIGAYASAIRGDAARPAVRRAVWRSAPVAAALLALLIGPVILRLTGKYFVLITFLFGEIVRMVFVDWQAVTGGANGITDIPGSGPIFAEPRNFYWLALLAAAVFASASAAGCCNRSSDAPWTRSARTSSSPNAPASR